jgi:hypothetical protein
LQSQLYIPISPLPSFYNFSDLLEVFTRIAFFVGAPIIAIIVRPFNIFVVTTNGAIGDILILFIMAVAEPTLTIPLPVAGVVPALESAAFGARGIAVRTRLAAIHSYAVSIGVNRMFAFTFAEISQYVVVVIVFVAILVGTGFASGAIWVIHTRFTVPTCYTIAVSVHSVFTCIAIDLSVIVEFAVQIVAASTTLIGVASSTFLLLTIAIVVDLVIAFVAFESVSIVGGFVGDAPAPRAFGAASARHAASRGYALAFLIDLVLAAIAPRVSITNITFDIVICHHAAFCTIRRWRGFSKIVILPKVVSAHLNHPQ